MTEEELKTAGWWYFGGALNSQEWRHPEVRDGERLTFAEAVRAEETRRKADGGG